MVTRLIRTAMMLDAALGIAMLLHAQYVHAEHASTQEVDSAVKFYDGVRVDPDKQKAYCEVRQAIGMMASGQGKFAEAQQKAAAATKRLGSDFAKAQNLSTRLDMTSEDTKRYMAARQALDKVCLK